MLVYAGSLAIAFLITALVRKKRMLSTYVCSTRFETYKAAFFAMLPLVIVAVCRWNVGIDSIYRGTYWSAYRYSEQGINILGFEPLFFLFMHMCAIAHIPFWGFLAIHSLIFMCCSIYAIKRGSVSVYVSIILFFSLFVFFDSFSSLRQSISEAVCMILISVMLTKEDGKKKDILAIILLILSSGFHLISLVYVPIYFLCKMKFSTKKFFQVTVASIAAYPILQRLFTLVMRYFFPGKYSFIGVSKYNLLLSFSVLIVSVLFYDNICSADEYGYKIVDLSLIIFVIMLNSNALLLPYRCFDCLKIGYIFIVPMIVKRIRKGKARFIVAAVFVLIFGYWFINAFFIQNTIFSDYHSIFEDLSVIRLP